MNLEVILNLVWLLLVASAFVALLAHRPACGGRVTWVMAVVALSCRRVLLFPIISATDDLYASSESVEEASYRPMRAMALLHGIAPVPETGFEHLAALAAEHLVPWSRITYIDRGNPSDGFAHPLQGRAPPAFATMTVAADLAAGTRSL